MTAFILIGIICLAAGVMYLLAPGALVRISEFLNRIISTDHRTLKYRITVGLILVVLGMFFLFTAYYLANFRGA